jgi:3-dehydroquinate synthase
MRNILEIKSKVSNYQLGFVDTLQEVEQYIDQPNTITFIDSNVDKLYPTLHRDSNIVLPSSEAIKSYTGVGRVLQNLTERKANIQTKLVVVGGGVLQDLVGFCASVYCRGIEYTLVPTTLLAQADSCVGGKTSINFENKKNIIGTFYPPTKIVIYSGFVETLSKLDFYSGVGEIYKFHILQNKIDDINVSFDIDRTVLDGLIYKTSILELDEFDKGERRFLNYGHTFGHALETSSGNAIPHGLAVILGCVIATRIARKLGYAVEDHDKIITLGVALFRASGVKLDPEWFDFDELIEITKSDKKSTGKLTMVLVDREPFLEVVENFSIVKEALKETYESI